MNKIFWPFFYCRASVAFNPINGLDPDKTLKAIIALLLLHKEKEKKR